MLTISFNTESRDLGYLLYSGSFSKLLSQIISSDLVSKSNESSKSDSGTSMSMVSLLLYPRVANFEKIKLSFRIVFKILSLELPY